MLRELLGSRGKESLRSQACLDHKHKAEKNKSKLNHNSEKTLMAILLSIYFCK